jgi:hypothetical protein
MKTFQWPLKAFLFVGLLQIISCTKTIDTSSNDSVSLESSSNATVANEFSNCKLRRIVYENPFVSESTVNMLFTYNAADNPFSVTHTGPLIVPTSGYPTTNYYFYYDGKNRLTRLLISHGENNFSEYTELHRYGYDNNDVIVTDTLLHPDWNGDPETFIAYITIGLTYDSQGRIIKETIKDLRNGTTRNPTYTYDSRGNLAVKGWKSSGYDNKVSIFRAHPIFQFIHRNYSRNNALPEAKYNSRGLPLAVRQLNDDFFGAYAVRYAGDASNPLGGIIRAVYDCQ